MTLEVIEEVADTRGIEVVELQPGRFCAMPRGGEDQHQPQGVPIGSERMRAGLPLPDQAVGEERLQCRAEDGHASPPIRRSRR